MKIDEKSIGLVLTPGFLVVRIRIRILHLFTNDSYVTYFYDDKFQNKQSTLPVSLQFFHQPGQARSRGYVESDSFCFCPPDRQSEPFLH